ncbi:TPA: hypothetical protein VLM34_000741 [Streptococcus pyogenes]|uniref:hypothetical protein n=1 Tax=Streptococcus pyogenes TaxID=1314 RepID=UPI000DA3E96C|nr:hypothetical protein [Streptococcus pyogenes]QCK44427.1 hypothetical protein ETT62_07300 [Streptococcus pyogenes]SQE79315.1 Uncharacterised protein [Streptococcus pyogenes]VHF57934.1 Uncharacterised protein [Streptococcus pyogenes]VHG43732.1 Uncharacterised protein [Streptococcus pyogenes]VHK20937.1 Uncharacterised protein [Streptococcus pyogenes]
MANQQIKLCILCDCKSKYISYRYTKKLGILNDNKATFSIFGWHKVRETSFQISVQPLKEMLQEDENKSKRLAEEYDLNGP